MTLNIDMKIQKDVGVVAACQIIIGLEFNLCGHITCERILAIQTTVHTHNVIIISFVHLTPQKQIL